MSHSLKRNGYCCGREQLKGLAKWDPESVFVEHSMNKHDGDFGTGTHFYFGFRMNVTDMNTAIYIYIFYTQMKIYTRSNI